MKFSCELNNIEYFFETIDGACLSDRHALLLSRKQRKQIQAGEAKYYTILVSATKDDLTLNFEIQGVPLSVSEEFQPEEIEDYIESQLVFSKIEEKIKHALTKDKNPIWATKDI
ncbi:hypothetical protein [Bacteriovorax sp. Seq25_V]|uniref:hypothetical protein n=1 Tax=Bacteriovorax sp. Seq25_V TaxID=1201288 RepID=UPI00038A175D|nr:hypothetical protein [Bacteriovorax sp. Seq25_V]EQC43668.1 hypothetical protein M900_1507 [Bacteriovorax sp. Seq25_V]